MSQLLCYGWLLCGNYAGDEVYPIVKLCNNNWSHTSMDVEDRDTFICLMKYNFPSSKISSIFFLHLYDFHKLLQIIRNTSNFAAYKDEKIINNVSTYILWQQSPTSIWSVNFSTWSLYCGKAWTIFCRSLVEISPPPLVENCNTKSLY
jgi:hypothetical protein